MCRLVCVLIVVPFLAEEWSDLFVYLLLCAVSAEEWSASSLLCRLGQGMVSLCKQAFFRPFCLSLNHSCVRGELLDGETPEGGGGDLDWLTRVSHAYKKEFWSIILLKQGCGEGHLH